MVPLPDPEGPSMVSTGMRSVIRPLCRAAQTNLPAIDRIGPCVAGRDKPFDTQPLDPPTICPLESRASFRTTPIFHLRSISSEVCHEGPVLPEVGEGPSPRLQGRSPPWQGLRDLQVEPAFQG